jgi:hypothetical protein
MQRRTRRIIIGVALIAALVAGGAAFTASLGANFPTGTVAGFGQDHIVGASAAGVNYALSSDGQYVTEADVYVTTDVSGDTVQAGFGDTVNDAVLASCTSSGTATVGGTYDGDYKSTCDFVGAGTGQATNGVPVNNANYFDASVTKDATHSTINGG